MVAAVQGSKLSVLSPGSRFRDRRVAPPLLREWCGPVEAKSVAATGEEDWAQPISSAEAKSTGQTRGRGESAT